ncbi:uncharacterized protein LOC117604806 isoform X2 [Osmia lignaria lignaria]|nr:uncharacterized protein LOC117604806 isoform X2 [Osmia lignaria]
MMQCEDTRTKQIALVLKAQIQVLLNLPVKVASCGDIGERHWLIRHRYQPQSKVKPPQSYSDRRGVLIYLLNIHISIFDLLR